SRVVAERGWIEAELLERLTGEAHPPDLGPWVVAPSVLATARNEVAAAVDAAGPLGLDVATLDPRQRAVLATLEGVEVEGGRARRPTAGDPLADHPYVAALEASPFEPPSPEGVDREELRELVRRGLVLQSDGTWFAPSAVEAASTAVARLLQEHPEGVTVAQVRDALGTTRKFLLPLLALLDGRGVTRRRGDVRIGGPRLPPTGA
ncbi:MAG: SelB C-terminal domain-containing protein, partial [Actinomycetota bacterium]|nr:SelB C-terminal domain-containing protein [Actinomycetota bacterium]